jgi:hypothetical protein
MGTQGIGRARCEKQDLTRAAARRDGVEAFRGGDEAPVNGGCSSEFLQHGEAYGMAQTQRIP